MTPRESLNKILEASLEVGGITNPKNITAPFAIGRWVPVSERLPEFDQGCFVGTVIMRNFHDRKGGTPESDIFPDEMFINKEITHWLELDLPSGKEDA